MHNYNDTYTNENLKHIAFPLGGIGAGMFCLEGSGMIGKVSLRNEPDVNFEPCVFSVIYTEQNGISNAKILEGQVPYNKIFGFSGESFDGAGNGLTGKLYGLPHFASNTFNARFPFATVNLRDDLIPLDVEITGWSPFIPLNADDSSKPIAGLEFKFTNTSSKNVKAVYYFSAKNFMEMKPEGREPTDEETAKVYSRQDGFILSQPIINGEEYKHGAFYAAIDDADIQVNTDWFRGGWFDTNTMQWNDIKSGNEKSVEASDNKSPGASISLSFELKPQEKKIVKLKLSWYVPKTTLRIGSGPDDEVCNCCSTSTTKPTHVPWYTTQFSNVEDVMDYFKKNYKKLYYESKKFSDTFYDSTLPNAALEAITANLTILKSPTVLRETSGDIWAWEGCCDSRGCCHGSCTHVWNYAQAMPHLFPDLEQTLRKTEFFVSQDSKGHQNFRTPLPIREPDHNSHAASDGQLGGIMKIYREWRILGDNDIIIKYWDKLQESLDYCIKTWDPKKEGVLTEPHHNTYDIEFWGADGMCSSFYLGALKAACKIGIALGKDIIEYDDLYSKGRKYMETELYNGEYFYQQVNWTKLDAKLDMTDPSIHTQKLLEKEGPKYQYGKGCLSDGILGAWMAKVCGLGDILDVEKIKSHLMAIYKYNFKDTLINHDNPQRPGYAVGDEAGLLLCSWPNGEKPSLPFVYSDEVWTGIEYQVASHLILMGYETEGMDIVKGCRDRYDGTKRNPFNEYECGHWYARAMASYALIQSISGVRYDAVEKILYVKKKHDNFSIFLSTSTGYGTVNIKNDKVTVDVKSGKIDIREIKIGS